MIMELSTNKTSVYQIKITLEKSKPPIWRRFQVMGDTRLSKLHRVVQIVMGWTNSHLHQFVIDGTYFSEPDPESMEEVVNERKVRLSEVVKHEKSRFVYEYDFGDGWKHALIVEKILPVETGVRYPRCLDGALACPPEDCGAIWGYYEKLAIMKDPLHPDHQAIVKWMGKDFDAKAFAVEETNQLLKRVK